MMKKSVDVPSSKPLTGAGLDPGSGEPPSPWLLNYACAISGFGIRSLRDGFKYCEIGVAGGTDLLFLAASNPAGHFFGIQTHGTSWTTVEELRSAAGLANFTVYQRSLDELEMLNIPSVDFLVLKGVLSREDAAARNAVLAFTARHLKPGGVVLCSYRTPHAWGFWEPMLHFLRSAAAAPGDRVENLQRGLMELRSLREAGAALFQISPLMGSILDSIGEFDLQTFDRAFLQAPNPSLHFDEVCDAMQGVGLAYAGALPLGTNYPQICLPADLRNRYAALAGPHLREAWKDLVRMPFFRQDLFTSAARADRPELPAETVLGSHLPRGHFQFAFDLPAVRLDGPLFQALADLLAENALRLGTILSAPALAAFPASEILSALAWMTAMEQIRPFAETPRDPGQEPFRLSRFNTAMLQRQLAGQRSDVQLASFTLGNGVSLSNREGLALLALSEAGPVHADDWAGRWLVNQALAGEGFPGESALGQIIRQVRSRPRSLAALGLSEKAQCI